MVTVRPYCGGSWVAVREQAGGEGSQCSTPHWDEPIGRGRVRGGEDPDHKWLILDPVRQNPED